MALQPAQRVRAARVDQPPDRGQVADASDIRMDGFPDGTGMSRGSMLQNPAECGYPKRGVEATGEELLPEHHWQVGDDPRCIGYAAGKVFQCRARRSTG
ncbi:hypothetical protein WR25_27020 [Diploscapter pachys]|uniref:Uncharacterized protein n=1 Tax=Diploscapter pachys TaxID=2018661 RepID=A0A2A2M5C4_9BILA|nr:hypothetical protein WR25_27020 [Diploscapter pachys]